MIRSASAASLNVARVGGEVVGGGAPGQIKARLVVAVQQALVELLAASVR